MSIVLNKIASNAGIVSVGHRDLEGRWTFVEGITSSAPNTSDEVAKIHTLFEKSLDLLDTVQESEVKVVFGDKTLVLQSSSGHVLGIVVCKGHPVVKSLQRMFRKTLSRLEKMTPPVSTATSDEVPNSEVSSEESFRPAVVDVSAGRDNSDSNLLN